MNIQPPIKPSQALYQSFSPLPLARSSWTYWVYEIIRTSPEITRIGGLAAMAWSVSALSPSNVTAVIGIVAFSALFTTSFVIKERMECLYKEMINTLPLPPPPSTPDITLQNILDNTEDVQKIYAHFAHHRFINQIIIATPFVSYLLAAFALGSTIGPFAIRLVAFSIFYSLAKILEDEIERSAYEATYNINHDPHSKIDRIERLTDDQIIKELSDFPQGILFFGFLHEKKKALCYALLMQQVGSKDFERACKACHLDPIALK